MDTPANSEQLEREMPEHYDSNEEVEFHHWLTEAEDKGLVDHVIYQPSPFVLSQEVSLTYAKQMKTKVKHVKKHLLRPHMYTADFVFCPTVVWWQYFGQDFLWSSSDVVQSDRQRIGERIWVDVKGSWTGRGGTQELSINKKWVYQKYGVIINTVRPTKLFQKTWVPDKCRLTPKQLKPRKRYEDCKTIEEFLYEKE